jgi:hypothetical protein
MAIEIAMMAAGFLLTQKGIQDEKAALVGAANSRERQNYEEMKRSQLGALQDHNARVQAFNEYEQSVLLTTTRQDRSIKAITQTAETKARKGMAASEIRALGQQARFATAAEQARMDRSAAKRSARNKTMQNFLNLGMKMHSVTPTGTID